VTEQRQSYGKASLRVINSSEEEPGFVGIVLDRKVNLVARQSGYEYD
jgi:hypothetical protein